MPARGTLNDEGRERPGETGFYTESDALPDSYSTGGVNVATPAASGDDIEDVVLAIENVQGYNNSIVLDVDVTEDADGSLTVTIYELDTQAATPAYSEVADATDISALNGQLAVTFEP